MQVDFSEEQLSDLYDALDEAIEAIGYAQELESDYEPEDIEAMRRKQDRWEVLREVVGSRITASMES